MADCVSSRGLCSCHTNRAPGAENAPVLVVRVCCKQAGVPHLRYGSVGEVGLQDCVGVRSRALCPACELAAVLGAALGCRSVGEVCRIVLVLVAEPCVLLELAAVLGAALVGGLCCSAACWLSIKRAAVLGGLLCIAVPTALSCHLSQLPMWSAGAVLLAVLVHCQ
jgi:hypothetical protein